MGLFDSVLMTCPVCHHDVEWQSHAGPCILSLHSTHQVPLAMAQDLDGVWAQCRGCGKPYELRVMGMTLPSTISMVVVS